MKTNLLIAYVITTFMSSYVCAESKEKAQVSNKQITVSKPAEVSPSSQLLKAQPVTKIQKMPVKTVPKLEQADQIMLKKQSGRDERIR